MYNPGYRCTHALYPLVDTDCRASDNLYYVNYGVSHDSQDIQLSKCTTCHAVPGSGGIHSTYLYRYMRSGYGG
jgi:hypothetical protein